MLGGTVGLRCHLHPTDQRFLFIPGHKFPGGVLPVLPGIGETVIFSFMGQIIVFLKGFDLLLHLFLLLIGEKIQIQLVAEASRHGHNPPGRQRRHPARLVVGHRRHMGSHGGNGISKRSSVLNFDPLQSVRIIAAPDLRMVIHHSQVKPAAASAAAFPENVGITGHQLLQQLVQPQHVPVAYLTLPFLGQAGAVNVTDIPVHIPFYILDIGTVQNGADSLIEIIPHLLPGHIQDQLVTAPVGPPLGNPDGPVRMRPVQIAVLGHCLRLKPQAKLQAQSVDLVCQRFQAAGQLLLIDVPVAQAAGVIVPLSEPAVIQHQHFHAQIRCASGDFQDLFAVEIKICGLPVVQQHRPAGMFVFSPAQMFPDNVMEIGGQLFQALAAEGHHRLRRAELRLGIQLPGKQLFGDSRCQTHLIHLILLQLDGIVAAVYQAHPVAGAVRLRGLGGAEDGEGIVVVAGGCSCAAHLHFSAHHRNPLHLPLHAVASVEMDQLPLAVHQIQIHGHRFFQDDGVLIFIIEPDTSGDNVLLFPHTVVQHRPKAGHRILQGDFQRVRVLRISVESRKAGNVIFSRNNLIGLVPQIHCVGPVRIADADAGNPVIAHTAAGILLGQGVQGIISFVSRLVDISGKSAVPQIHQITHILLPYGRAVIGVNQYSVGVHFHLIRCILCRKGESFVFLAVIDCHLVILHLFS